MRRTRSVITLLLAVAALLTVAPGGTVVLGGTAAASQPANRGWHSPFDAVQEFARP